MPILLTLSLLLAGILVGLAVVQSARREDARLLSRAMLAASALIIIGICAGILTTH